MKVPYPIKCVWAALWCIPCYASLAVFCVLVGIVNCSWRVAIERWQDNA